MPSNDLDPSAPATPIRAAGGVLWRPDTYRGEVEVALIHRPRYDDWSLPKGKLEPDEHPAHAAVREIAEETGFHSVLGRRLPLIRYLAGGRPKQVRYFAARAVGGRFEANAEVDRMRWLPVDAARRRLTRPQDLGVLDAFAAGPPHTTPIVLLRHAAAVSRAQFTEATGGEVGDEQRPLSGTGLADADALGPLLARFGDMRVVTSPALRCVETIVPYAAEAVRRIVREPLLGEIAFEQDAEATLDWFRERIISGQPQLLCTHRPLLPALLEIALADPKRGRSPVRVPKRKLHPGQAYVVHIASGRSGLAVACDPLHLTQWRTT